MVRKFSSQVVDSVIRPESPRETDQDGQLDAIHQGYVQINSQVVRRAVRLSIFPWSSGAGDRSTVVMDSKINILIKLIKIVDLHRYAKKQLPLTCGDLPYRPYKEVLLTESLVDLLQLPTICYTP